MRDLRPLTLEEMTSLPVHIQVSSLLPASAERVLSTLADPEPWPQWFSFIRKVEYLSAARGVGSERDVTTKIGVIREHFLAWEPTRLSFFVRQSNAVGLAAFAEDYQIEALGEYSRLTWHIYADFQPLFRPLACVVPTVGRLMFSESLLSFSAWLSSHR
jgi:Polyketide cyclase / dehydrase and lipid transport